MVKPLQNQNKKGQNIFQMHCFLNPFLQLAVEKKVSKNSAARKIFDPSQFVTALPSEIKPPLCMIYESKQNVNTSNLHKTLILPLPCTFYVSLYDKSCISSFSFSQGVPSNQLALKGKKSCSKSNLDPKQSYASQVLYARHHNLLLITNCSCTLNKDSIKIPGCFRRLKP